MPPPEMDVQTAINTLDRALSYTQPLRRRLEGITWIMFGLASALFVFSYVWLWQNGYDPTFRLFLVWLAGYALVGIVPALLVWRVASIVHEGYPVDGRRVAMGAAALALVLVALNFALWHLLGETPLAVALTIALFGGAAWGALGLVQWSRLSASGRRDTIIIAVGIVVMGIALVYILGADASTVNLDALIFVLTTAVVPLAAGLWRLARG